MLKVWRFLRSKTKPLPQAKSATRHGKGHSRRNKHKRHRRTLKQTHNELYPPFHPYQGVYYQQPMVCMPMQYVAPMQAFVAPDVQPYQTSPPAMPEKHFATPFSRGLGTPPASPPAPSSTGPLVVASPARPASRPWALSPDDVVMARFRHSLGYTATLAKRTRAVLAQTACAYVASRSDKYAAISRELGGYTVGVDPRGRTVRKRDLQPLFSSAWLNDESINAYGEFIMAAARTRGRSVHIMSSFFHSKITARGFDYESVSRWSDRSNIVPYDLDVLAFPINTANTHWTAAAVDRRLRAVVHYDSFLSPKGPAIARTILRYLMAEYLRRHPTAERQAVLDAVVPATGEWVIIDGAGQAPLTDEVDLGAIYSVALRDVEVILRPAVVEDDDCFDLDSSDDDTPAPGPRAPSPFDLDSSECESVLDDSDCGDETDDDDRHAPYPAGYLGFDYSAGGEADLTSTDVLTEWGAAGEQVGRDAMAAFPEQHNGYDCGVFSSMFIRCVALGHPLWFAQEAMGTCRRMMVLEMNNGELW